MIKKCTILFTLICAVAIIPAFAQEPPPAIEAAHNAVVRFLQLDEGQTAAWDQLYADHRAAEQPVQEMMADLQAQLEELFDEESPDPTAVGSLVIQRRDLGEQLIQIHQDYNDAFTALLTEEQVNRLQFIRRAEDVQKFIPAFKAFELIRRN